ncbi:MAG: ABC transporter ATP-binding protein, partial [Cyanothece sp. SIO2G6]|nr:ABC transporter ATP-binding protein [Cyanothece sp. SIO2G6]
MVSIDDSRWPVVSARFQGAGTPAEMAEFYARFEQWLAKQEPFALVLQRDNAEAAEEQGKRSPAVKQMRKEGMAWTKAHKSQISQYCAGVAMVPDSAKLIKLWGPIVGTITKTMYGCPGKVFSSTEHAKVWATEQLGRAKITTVGGGSLKPIVLKRKAALILSGLLAVIGAGLGLVPYYLIYLVSLRLLDASPEPLSPGLDPQYIWQLAWLAVGAVVGKSICMGLSSRLSHIAAYTILYDLRIELARKLGTLPLGYFTRRTTGDIKKIIHEDVEQLEQGLAHMIPDITAGVAVPLMAGILLLLVDWRMTLATLASAAIALGLFGFMMSRFDMSAYNALLTRMNGIVIQYINGMKVIKAFTRSDASFGQLQDVIDEMRQVYVRVTRTAALPMAVMLTLMRSAAVTIIPVGIVLYLSGALSIPTFVLFVVMGIGFNRPIMAVIFHGMTGFYQVNQASQRIAEIFKQPEITSPLNPQRPKGNAIAFHDVSFSYGDVQALKNISFTAAAGQVTALVGPSGAGKSTIAKLIPRFWDVDNGTITIGKVNVKAIAVEDLMNQVSFVFQDVFLFNDTIRANIAIGKPDATGPEIIAAAKAARCHEFIEALPQGYETPVGENGVFLSGGQRQRLSIARAMLKDAPIIVLDEATAYIDPENEALVQTALANLLAGDDKTLVVIAHRLSTITGADQILVIDQGQIVAQGTHERLLETCDLYQTQWQSHRTAQTWQFQSSTGLSPQTIIEPNQPPHADMTHPSEMDKPLENPYRFLDETDTIWTMMRKLIPPQADHYFWRAVRWRIVEGMSIGSTSYVVYLVLVALFQASQSPERLDQGQLWGYLVMIVGLC